jgi:hypothetical protein
VIRRLSGRRFPPFSAAKRRRSFLFDGLQGGSREILAAAPFIEQRSIWMTSASRAMTSK